MPLTLIKDRIFKTGNYTLVGAVFAIVLDKWGVINLSNIPVPHLIDVLYIYLMINASAAAPYMYLEKRRRVAVSKYCPECGNELEITQKFKCPACGEIRIGK